MCLSDESKLTMLMVLIVFQVSSTLNEVFKVSNLTPKLNNRNNSDYKLIDLSADLLPNFLNPFPIHAGESLISDTWWFISKSFHAERDISFYLCTKRAADQREELRLYDLNSIRASRFNASHPTRFIIHGWFGSEYSILFSSLTPAYLRNGKYNIILVDWGKGAIADYTTAARRVKPVGIVLARFVDFLHRETGTRFEDIHLIGFSMGAHIAGIAAKFVENGRIPVIFGLDPAMPMFSFENTNGRLTSNDASYVEVIHTNAGGYGYEAALGHADFYVNYGNHQPGCILAECSHLRAFKYFGESINSRRGFWAKGCNPKTVYSLLKNQRCHHKTADRALLGGNSFQKNVSGVFYLRTNPTPPYAKD